MNCAIHEATKRTPAVRIESFGAVAYHTFDTWPMLSRNGA